MSAAPYSHPDFVFASCSIGSPERIWFLVEDEDLFRMVHLNGTKWVQKSVEWDAVAVCGRTVPEREVYIFGLEGEVLHATPAGYADEQLDPVEKRPEKVGVMRDARLISGVPYVVGMARQVYKRGKSAWQIISESIMTKKSPKSGFNSIDGTGPDDLIAVGMQGEIWRYDGKAWTQVESPTNVSLNRVRCADKKRAYACGQAGMVLQIERGTVKPAAEPIKGQNFYGLAIFKEKVYVATMKALYVLADGALDEVDPRLGDGFTTGYLETDGETLWSVGAHHIAKTTDGKKWSLVKCEI